MAGHLPAYGGLAVGVEAPGHNVARLEPVKAVAQLLVLAAAAA